MNKRISGKGSRPSENKRGGAKVSSRFSFEGRVPGRCINHPRRRAASKQNKCCACKLAYEKSHDPVALAFRKLKFRAKERGHEFGLSRSRFAALWLAWEGEHGRKAKSFSVDRVDSARGYFDDNVRAMDLGSNAREAWVEWRQAGACR